MKRALAICITFSVIFLSAGSCIAEQAPSEEWITILIHGAIGVAKNLSGRTICLIKKDCIEGSSYERSILSMRENNPRLFNRHAIGNLGLHPVTEATHGAYLFSLLYSDLAQRYQGSQNNRFYTFGWSGLISEKSRMTEARNFYCVLKKLIAQNPKAKIRIIGYSHGATLLTNLARIRREFCGDTFIIDETYFLGLPINRIAEEAIFCPLFSKIYNIYSHADKIQRMDVFTSTYIFSDRFFKGELPQGLKQIQVKYVAPLREIPGQVLPSAMRGTINQSPGHIELWSFGWAESMYRKNLDMYPLCTGVFIPYLAHAANQIKDQHVILDIRPISESTYVTDYCKCTDICIPFLNQADYTAFKHKALCHHPYLGTN